MIVLLSYYQLDAVSSSTTYFQDLRLYNIKKFHHHRHLFCPATALVPTNIFNNLIMNFLQSESLFSIQNILISISDDSVVIPCTNA